MPTWLFYWGAAIVLVVSFVLLGVLWRTPLLARTRAWAGAPVGALARRPRAGAHRRAGRLGRAVRARLARPRCSGTRDPFRNLAPTWIYVIFWLGVPLLSVCSVTCGAGSVPGARSPTHSSGCGSASGSDAKPLADYPERLGRWPGALALLAFVGARARLLGPGEPARARVRDRALLLRRALRDGDVRPRRPGGDAARASRSCTAYLARMAPLHVERRPHPRALAVHRPRRRRAGARVGRLRRRDARLGRCSTASAGRRRGRTSSRASRARTSSTTRPRRAARHRSLTSAGCSRASCSSALAYQAACAAARWTVNAPRSLAGDFLLLPRADRVRLHGRPLLHAVRPAGPVRDPAALRPVGPGLEPLRHGARDARPRR